MRSLATILDRAVDLALEKKDPRRRQERRLARERRRDARLAESRPGEVLKEEEAREETPATPTRSPEPEREAEDKEAARAPARSRYIPLPVRGRVLERAGYRCEYSGPDGTRCTSRTGLEIEHERPFAIFRSHDERFLLAYCHRHNRLSAERTYGVEFIRGKIEEKKRQGAATTLVSP